MQAKSSPDTMTDIVIYTNGNQETDRLIHLLHSVDMPVTHQYLLGVDFSDRQFRSEFGSEAEYPQTSIGYQHIGSLKEVLRFLKERGDI